MIIISGIQPGNSGVGRVISFLVDEAKRDPVSKVRFIFGLAGGPSIKQLVLNGRLNFAFKTAWIRINRKHRLNQALSNREILDNKNVILVHPQTLGFNWCLQFIKLRAQPTWIYVMDSSFFCIRSYNHLTGETEACTHCLGREYKNATVYDCKPFPSNDPNAMNFIKALPSLVKEGKVNFLVQNKKQGELVRTQFGDQATIKLIGLWAKDWDVTSITGNTINEESSTDQIYDVVYHGTPLGAKGVDWAIELARKCPEWKFLFPFNKSAIQSIHGENLPPNCKFQAMTWESGLEAAITQATVTLVPSLWSAPIEGAFVKSLMLGKAVGIVDNASGYASEVPPSLLLVLPQNVDQAAEGLKSALVARWRPDPDLLSKWIRTFTDVNRRLLDNMLTLSNE